MIQHLYTKKLKQGFEIFPEYYQSVLYLPKHNTVLITCPRGCCDESITLEQFNERMTPDDRPENELERILIRNEQEYKQNFADPSIF